MGKKNKNISEKSVSIKKNVGKSKKKKKFAGVSKKELNKVASSKSKAAKLLMNPVNVEANEFENIVTMEEMKECKFIGTIKKTGKHFTQDWAKEGERVRVSQPRVLNTYNAVEVPVKKRITGRDAIGSSSNEKDPNIEPKAKKRKNNKQPKVKASYDKTADELEAIKQAKDAKDSGIDEDSNSNNSSASAITAIPKLTRKIKCVDVSAWDTLHVPEPIKKALSELGFSKPTKIQELTLGPAIKDRLDILGAAETGSGKTLAFGIPIIANIYNDRHRMEEKKQQQLKNDKLREKTMSRKRKRDEAYDSDEAPEDSSEEENKEAEEYLETDESDVEEYLCNGPDGVMDVEYSALDEKDAADDHLDASEDESEMSSEGENDSQKEHNEEVNSEDEEQDVNEYDMEDSDVERDSDDMDQYVDSENDDVEDLENYEDISENDDSSQNEVSKNDDSDDSISENDSDDDDPGNAVDSDDLGSDDEKDMEQAEQTSGCVRVINNVQFPFEKKEKFVDDGEKPMMRALILTPTRELAVQIHSHLSRLCTHTGIKSGVIVGGLDARKQKRVLQRTRPEIVVATPGRLWELIQDGIQHVADLRALRYLAIDEADRMIDRKNFEEVHKIVRLMNSGTGIKNNVSSSHRQTFVFSATLTLVHKLPERLYNNKKNTPGPTSEDKLQKLAKMVGTKPSAKILDVTRQHATAENLTECRINCDVTEKDQYLYYFLQRHPGRTMVFCNSIEAVRRLRSIFVLLQCSPLDLHASMHQKQRLRNLQQFTERENGLLITTDVAARGLDITGVRHVLHYQVPFTAESYVHRSGRTARGDESGLSVVFVEPKELLRFRQICTTLGRTSVNELPAFPVDENLYDQVHERIKMATALEKLIHQTKREDQYKSEKKLISDNIGVMESDEEVDQEDIKLMPKAYRDKLNSGGTKIQIKQMRVKLCELVQQPLLGAMFSYNHPTNRAALAATMGIEESAVPQELVGVNPTRNMFADDAEESYRERYAREIYGDAPDPSQKTDACSVLKKQRKDMAKLTKKLLKPLETAREVAKRNKEKKIDLQQKKAAKKREKRHKKKMQKK